MCSLARRVTLTMPVFTQEYKHVKINHQRKQTQSSKKGATAWLPSSFTIETFCFLVARDLRQENATLTENSMKLHFAEDLFVELSIVRMIVTHDS